MSEDLVMSIGADALRTTIYLAGPLLVTAMLIGIVVSILQAVTQINESTLTFIPKVVGIILVLVVMAPWMVEVMSNYTEQVIITAGQIRPE